MVAMKVRSCVLIACMLVVPALALFSHLMPPTVRKMMRKAGSVPPRRAVPVASASPASDTVPQPVVTDTPPRPVAVVNPPPVLPLPPVQRLPAERPAPSNDVPRSQAEWSELADLRARLIALGATAIDCKLGPGGGQLHTCSCRVAVDTEGQLHRMFHGVGPDATVAMRALLERVEAWRIQQAGSTRRRS